MSAYFPTPQSEFELDAEGLALLEVLYQTQAVYDAAKLLHHAYKRAYVCVTAHRVWYHEMGDNVWVELENGQQLRNKLSSFTGILGVVRDHLRKAATEVMECIDQELQIKLQSECLKITSLMDKLRSSEFKNDVMRAAGELYFMANLADIKIKPQHQVVALQDVDRMLDALSAKLSAQMGALLQPPAEVFKDDYEKRVKAKIPSKVRADVWNTYQDQNMAIGKCCCCKRATIKQADFEVGHVIAEACGGTMEINNLRPICSVCNKSMGRLNMVEYVKRYGYYIG
jgi:hypothetical protein